MPCLPQMLVTGAKAQRHPDRSPYDRGSRSGLSASRNDKDLDEGSINRERTISWQGRETLQHMYRENKVVHWRDVSNLEKFKTGTAEFN